MSSSPRSVGSRLSHDRIGFFRHSALRVIYWSLIMLGLAGAALAEREMHVVGLYEGRDGGTEAKVTVDRPGQNVTLFLSAYDPVVWQVTVVGGTTIERVFLDGYYAQDVTGLPAGVPVSRQSYEAGTGYIYVGYSVESSRFLRSIPAINALTGQEIASFHGAYQPSAEPIVINAVQDDPRLSTSYPKPVPLDQLPDVRYQIATYDASRTVTVRDYTLAGPVGGAKIIPEGLRVNADAARRIYYGGQDGLTAIDTQAGTVQNIPLPPDAEREGWQMGTAFDTLRARGLVVTLAGEGFVYAYSPAAATWSTAFSMRNRDFNCLEYHAASDTLWGVTISHEDSVYSKLVGLKAADGTLVREISLPVFPFDVDFSDHRSEVVSAGEYLVILLQPRSPLSNYNRSIPESRIYLCDPRTGELWLTYRSTPPANQPPVVQIVSPSPNQVLTAGSTVQITASAADPDGTIQSVEFFVDNVSLGFGTPVTSSSYRIPWTVPASGEHTIKAVARDNRNAAGNSQPVTVRVNQKPVVRLVHPTDGSTFPLQEPVELKAIATDPNDSIAAVHFIVNGLPIGPSRRLEGTDEYILRWAPSGVGDHTIQARATDTFGGVAFSETVTVHVAVPPSSVAIVSPANGSAVLQFTRVEIVAAVTSDLEVATVEFFVDDVSVGAARRMHGRTFSQSWIARGVGDHALTARATMRSGELATSPAITVSVTSEGGTARRLLPAQYRPGRAFRAGILVTPGKGAGTYTIIEMPPPGWSITEISDGGTYDAATGKITFGPIAADSVKLLTYTITPPSTAKDTQTFSGTLEVDGITTSIVGQQTINGPNAKRPVLRKALTK